MKNFFSSTIAFILGLIIGGLVLLTGGLLGGMIFGAYMVDSVRPKNSFTFSQYLKDPKNLHKEDVKEGN